VKDALSAAHKVVSSQPSIPRVLTLCAIGIFMWQRIADFLIYYAQSDFDHGYEGMRPRMVYLQVLFDNLIEFAVLWVIYGAVRRLDDLATPNAMAGRCLVRRRL
jgi:hypothetical protein